MRGIYLKDKIRFCKAISGLLGKSRFYLQINLSQYTRESQLTTDLFTVCENSSGDLRQLNIEKTWGKLGLAR